MAKAQLSRPLLLIAAASVVVMALLGLGTQDVHQAIEYVDTWPGGDEPVVLLLDFADDVDDDERDELLRELPASFSLNSIYSDEEGIYRAELPNASVAQFIASRWEDDDRVEFIEPEYRYDASFTPNDPYYQFQWHLDQIGMETAWDRSMGSGAVVAVIDTGVVFAPDNRRDYPAIEDLDGFVDGYDFVDDDDFPFDEHGHGTHVAGTVAQVTDNDYGTAGVAPGASIMPLRVLNRYGWGTNGDIADAIRFAADNGADVINMSLGGTFPSELVSDACDYAHNKGVVIIAAAGNSSTNRPHYPAANEHVIAVSATQYDRMTTFYSNYGAYIDIAAPGGNTELDQNDDGQVDGVMQETIERMNPRRHEFALYMGTSMAAPHVAGVAAQIVAQGVTHPDRVEEILLSSADSSLDSYTKERYGQGLLDADAATAFPLVHYQLPRLALALIVAFILAGFSRRDLFSKTLQSTTTLGTAAVAASGFALVALVLAMVGVSAAFLAPLSSSILHWPNAVGLQWLSNNAIWMSALPLLGIYALFGGTRSKIGGSLLIGLFVGISAALLGEAMAPMQDVVLIPGAGLLDRVWLLANGAAGLGLARLAVPRG